MDSQERIEHLIDESTWRPLDETLSPCDPLEFRDQKPYTERLKDAQEKTGLQDAVQTGTGMLDGIPIALGVMDFHFMGGSMGSAVGEKITRLIEYATQEGLTLVLVCASGGARMQEGIFSLMQMAKISSALHIYQSCANLLYIAVLTSPTTGGVTASFAMLGDLIFAEPKALIGFAGRRVIEQTLQEDLPDDFQTSEYLLHHGLLDLIVPRCFLKQALSETITLYRDAPFKRVGSIPYGVQSRLYFLTEERARRKWGQWTSDQVDGHRTPGAIELSRGPSMASETSKSEGPQPLDPTGQRGAMPSEDTLASLNDAPFKAALTSWLKDSSRDEPYRQILVSFQAMFSLLAASSSPVNPLPPSEMAKTGKAVVGPVPVAGSQPPSSSLQGVGNAAEPHGASPSLESAIAVGAEEEIAWRAFYTNQKLSPKVMFLEDIGSIGDGEGAEEGEIGRGDKKFFYQMIVSNSRA